MEKLIWHTEQRQIKALIPTEGNPRQLTKKQAIDLEKSLKKFNLVDIPAINTDLRIISGHQRITILKTLGRGEEKIDVRAPNRKLTEEEHREYMLRANFNQGEWDIDLLANIDDNLLEDIGFDLEEMFGLDDKIDEKADKVPEVRETDIKLGDMFKLGNHRLLAGDATKKEDVDRLMQGEKADMVFCDPPYNVDYGVSKKPRHKIRTIKNDKQSPEEWKDFCNDLFLIFKEYNNGDIYMWGASGPEGMRMRLWLVEMGCHWSATIVWKKQQLVLSPAKYQRMYEPCFYGWFDKSSFCGDRKQTEVWEIDRPLNSKLHPTMKPVELCAKGILNSSPRYGKVLDGFGGSGSTLIACEKTNRQCRMMEIDPQYCQVIIDRYEEYTGKKAEKIT